MENNQIQTNTSIVIVAAYGYHHEKFWRVYKDGIIRAEVNELTEAKRIAELLKYETHERPN
jgi:DNA repair ATPase RecN